MSAETASPVHAGEADRWGGWDWREPARGEHFRRCSYCGSMHPDDLVTTARGRVDWADRKYGWPHKFYVHVPNQTPDALFCVGSSPIVIEGSPNYQGFVNSGDLTPEQRDIIVRDGWGGVDENRSYLFGTRPEHFGKVYTVHLADPALSVETRTAAAEMCGLAFEFADGGRIRWTSAFAS